MSRLRKALPRRLVAEWGRLTSEVAPLVSPILLLVRDAAGADSEMAALMSEMDGDRLRRMIPNTNLFTAEISGRATALTTRARCGPG